MIYYLLGMGHGVLGIGHWEETKGQGEGKDAVASSNFCPLACPTALSPPFHLQSFL